MPSKSDSAGKLHQYFTGLSLYEANPGSVFNSPLKNEGIRNIHLSPFNDSEIRSLENIGKLSASEIRKHIGGEKLTVIEDIGVSSGASGHTNTDDLEVSLGSGKKIGYSLKCATNMNQILSKNMGAKSLISSYFCSPEKQAEFNSDYEKALLCFLNQFFGGNEVNPSSLRREIDSYAREKGFTKARFSDFNYMNECRDVFLRKLRDSLIDTINKIGKDKLACAVNIILDTNKHHIIAVYGKSERVEYSRTEDKKQSDIVSINTRGNDSVVINTGDYEIGFRYKFESGITSSIKLVGDYKKI